MISRAERASDSFQRFLAKAGTLPHLLVGTLLVIADVIFLVFTIIYFLVHKDIYIFGASLLLFLLGAGCVTVLGFQILPDWVSRELPDEGGKERFATDKEVAVLYGPPDYTAP